MSTPARTPTAARRATAPLPGALLLVLFGLFAPGCPGVLAATADPALGGGFVVSGDALMPVAVGGGFRIDRDVLAAGGGTASTATGALQIDQVIAEPVVGVQRGAGFVLQGGFLAPAEAADALLFVDGFESR